MYLEMRAETAEIHRLSEISQRSLLEVGPQGGGYAGTGVLVSNARGIPMPPRVAVKAESEAEPNPGSSHQRAAAPGLRPLIRKRQ
jgi:hypothetical protein